VSSLSASASVRVWRCFVRCSLNDTDGPSIAHRVRVAEMAGLDRQRTVAQISDAGEGLSAWACSCSHTPCLA
jgi:hypothetical protein